MAFIDLTNVDVVAEVSSDAKMLVEENGEIKRTAIPKMESINNVNGLKIIDITVSYSDVNESECFSSLTVNGKEYPRTDGGWKNDEAEINSPELYNILKEYDMAKVVINGDYNDGKGIATFSIVGTSLYMHLVNYSYGIELPINNW